jgi:poly-gamma-glutamate synthesis protein (capsule biosynthesis protein)
MPDGLLTLFLCGDVMLGRGVDQILPHPGDPELRERVVTDARHYVRFAELVNGPIPQPASFSWPWGDAVEVLDDSAPDARVINLETTVTRSAEFGLGKPVHYRMNPDNLPSLLVARPDACALANNHALDLGPTGLQETLDALAGAGLRAVGAGRDAVEAWQPAAISPPGEGRALVLSCGAASSGIPAGWAATTTGPGVAFLTSLCDTVADDIIGRVREVKQPGDVVVVSIHWGSNWGYEVDHDQVRFAHRLIDGGVDVIHGHSSHHPRPIEVYRGKLVLYGCGDFIDDYEGIGGYEIFRDDLRLMYLASVAQDSGTLAALRIVPMQVSKMRLRHASTRDSEWLCDALETMSGDFGCQVSCLPDGVLLVNLFLAACRVAGERALAVRIAADVDDLGAVDAEDLVEVLRGCGPGSFSSPGNG